MTVVAAAVPLAEPSAVDDESAYLEGMRAFSAGALMTSCPYPVGSAKRDVWESGWFDFARAVRMLPDD